jgi:hypothetical protein
MTESRRVYVEQANATTSLGGIPHGDEGTRPFLEGCARPASQMKPNSTHDSAVRAPRLLTRAQAAIYCNISVSTFSNWVKIGRLPLPISGTNRWDLRAIDQALDALSGITNEPASALDLWKLQRARRS